MEENISSNETTDELDELWEDVQSSHTEKQDTIECITNPYGFNFNAKY